MLENHHDNNEQNKNDRSNEEPILMKTKKNDYEEWDLEKGKKYKNYYSQKDHEWENKKRYDEYQKYMNDNVPWIIKYIQFIIHAILYPVQMFLPVLRIRFDSHIFFQFEVPFCSLTVKFSIFTVWIMLLIIYERTRSVSG